MRLYIRGDYSKNILFDYRYLAEKMWFKERNGEPLDISYSGYLRIFNDNPDITLKLNKRANDDRWNQVDVPVNEEVIISLMIESIDLDFEEHYVSDYRERGDYLRIITTHQDLLTVDKRAAYIMAIEVATAIDGQISTDDKKTWLTVDEFKAEHSGILSLTYEEATDISLEEILTMEAVFEPLQDELDEAREEYIKIHGERVWEDEDEETFGI
ncbi:hypothetical protein [Streptococcus sp.]|uniref:hypothetical protein n=1 Tax=Streptococcus sp. TaxID=1306 RepID=UPI0035A161E2